MKLILGPKALKEAARFVDWLVLQGIDHGLAAEAVQKFALTIAGKKPRTEEEHTHAGPFLREYEDVYIAKFQQPPVIQPKDYSLAAKLLRQYGMRLCLQRMRELAASTDPFIVRAGFTMGTLTGQWNRLTAVAASAVRRTSASPAPSDCRHQPPCRNAIDHSQRALNDLRTSPSSGATSRPHIT